MGHKVGYKHRPHRSSLQFWPRVRAKREYPSVHWKEIEELGPSGFPVYKAGMTHASIIDNIKTSPNKGKRVNVPITVLEAPPCKVIGARFYKKTSSGKKAIGQVLTTTSDKYLKRKTIAPKKQTKTFDEYKDYDDVKLIIQTQPHLIGLKKTPEIMEIGLGGKLSDKVAYAKSMIDKEIKIADVIKEGMQVDTNGVTKGKGVQGSVKRHGIMEFRHKGEKRRRVVQSIGPTSPRKVSWKVPQFGQMGYQTRVEYNKWVLKVGDKPEEINAKGGFKGYGNVSKDYLLLKGSVAGSNKRMIILRKAVRPNKVLPKIPPQIKYISLSSGQGGRA